MSVIEERARRLTRRALENARASVEREISQSQSARLTAPGFVSTLRMLTSSWAAVEIAHGGRWVPVFIGAGAATYFGLAFEPALAVFLYPMLGFALIALGIDRPAVRRTCIAAALFALGGFAAEIRTQQVHAPVLSGSLPIGEVSGSVVFLEKGNGRQRYTIRVHSIEGVSPEDLPEKVRVTWRGAPADARPGDSIRLKAKLSPPPDAAAPGAFDFRRHFYFLRIGAVGFAVSAPEKISSQSRTGLAWWQVNIERARDRIAERIRTAAPGQGGAIISALVTGKRGAIDEHSENALRDAGLAHLLAISGMHMGLATGLIFFAVRFLGAAIPGMAVRFSIKKWAAAAALASGFIYLMLSGGAWSAQRAFVMTGVMFVAIMADRRALSLRNIAIAATVILLMTPEAILHPGFQMSFAAATALIAAFDWASGKFSRHGAKSIGDRLKQYVLVIALTDTIAALATAPFSLFHFHRAAVYSLIANVAATPIMGLWIMPFAIFGLILSPIGLDGPVWQFAAAGVEVILSVATAVSGWSGAIAATPQWPLPALVTVTFGGLWLCLSIKPWRLFGFVIMAAGFVAASLHTAPIGFVSRDGDNAAIVVRANDGQLVLGAFHKNRDRFVLNVWAELAGIDPLANKALGFDKIGQCDEFGCVIPSKEILISVIESPDGLETDCARADVVIALFPVSNDSEADCTAHLVDRADAWARGAHAIRISKDGRLDIDAAAPMEQAPRPWDRRSMRLDEGQ